MSKLKAIETAKKLAKKKGEEMHVVWDVSPDGYEMTYHVATSEDVETFFLGAEIVLSVN